jgi:endonuclease/exonuclease/phosphatase family metal-dependent hydrolase
MERRTVALTAAFENPGANLAVALIHLPSIRRHIRAASSDFVKREAFSEPRHPW